MDGEIHAAEADGGIHTLLSVDAQFGGRILFVSRHKSGALHKHTAGPARAVEDETVERLKNFDNEPDLRVGREEFPAFLPFGHREVSEEVFVDEAERVARDSGGNLGDFLEQFLEEGAGEEVVGLGQDAGELRVVLLDVAHGGIDLRADVLGFGTVEQVIEPRLGGQIEDAFGVVSGGFIDA